jgi:hypothetical protein
MMECEHVHRRMNFKHILIILHHTQGLFRGNKTYTGVLKPYPPKQLFLIIHTTGCEKGDIVMVKFQILHLTSLYLKCVTKLKMHTMG